MLIGVANLVSTSISRFHRASDKRRAKLAAAVRPCVEMMEQRRLLSAGDLDTTGFGVGGLVNDSVVPGSANTGTAMALHAGKIVVAGISFDGSDQLFTVARYDSDGSLDTTFGGGDGVSTVSVGDNASANAVAVQGDGSIIVAGFAESATVGDALDFTIVRLDSDGVYDGAFGGDGIVQIDFNNSVDQCFGLALQAGKIILAGSTGDGLVSDFALARLNSNGTLDTTFGGGIDDDLGLRTTDFGPNDQINAALVQTNGDIVVAGFTFDGVSNYDMAFARYDDDGNLDQLGFGTGGKVTVNFDDEDQAFALAQQIDGRIVAAGYTTDDDTSEARFALARFDTNGSLDTDFSGGSVTTGFSMSGGFDVARAIAVQSDGKIVAAGSALVGGVFDFALARYEANGSLDSTFGVDGLVTTNFGEDVDQANAIAIQGDGKIVAAGVTSDGALLDPYAEFALARYSGAGNTNPTATFTAGTDVTLYNAYTVSFSNPVDPEGGPFTYSYDFNGDEDFDDPGELSGSASASATFVYSVPDDYTVRCRIEDGDGGFTEYTQEVTVDPPATTASVITDPFNPDASALLVYATESADIIVVAITGNGALQGTMGGTIQFGGMAPLENKPFGRVIIAGNGGGDIVVMASVGIPAVVFGGSGNDSILTGGGNDILVGGDGNDRLYAGGGADLIIGGDGADTLRGDAGNDSLISGWTDYDSDLVALNALVTNPLLLSTSFMHDDGDVDRLSGNQGTDRFFANQDVVADIITDLSGSETWEDLC